MREIIIMPLPFIALSYLKGETQKIWCQILNHPLLKLIFIDLICFSTLWYLF